MKILDGLPGTTTDDLIRHFERLSACVTPDCDAEPLHSFAAEIAIHLKEFKAKEEELHPDTDYLKEREDEIWTEMKQLNGLMELYLFLSAPPPSEVIPTPLPSPLN